MRLMQCMEINGRVKRQMLHLFQKIELRILMRITAEACGQVPPSLTGLTAGECLAFYRYYTADALSVRSREELSCFRREMYRRAYRVGRMLSLLPGLNEKRKKRLIVFLYSNIGIDIVGSAGTIASMKSKSAQGSKEEQISTKVQAADDVKASTTAQAEDDRIIWKFYVPRCSFSAHYTPQMCYVMSGLDAGIICGIFGGGSLKFYRRLTEGYPACSAVFCREFKRKK